mgnify:CR=1 FL=1
MWTLKSADEMKAAAALLPHTKPQQEMEVYADYSDAEAPALTALAAMITATQYKGRLWMRLGSRTTRDEMLAQLMGAM